MVSKLEVIMKMEINTEAGINKSIQRNCRDLIEKLETEGIYIDGDVCKTSFTWNDTFTMPLTFTTVSRLKIIVENTHAPAWMPLRKLRDCMFERLEKVGIVDFHLQSDIDVKVTDE